MPDLIIEILSPGNRQFDEVLKKALYEKFGVKEYWIIDPDTLKAEGYFYQNQHFIPLGIFSGKISSRLLDHDFSFTDLT
ncbi:MAG: Uma2 family endonuclease [Cyclobacteriaceae bacterium]|nr:Uma2 family endonuclease [Cyclobacteriaceae bacterium]